jgi:hypothetical protein
MLHVSYGTLSIHYTMHKLSSSLLFYSIPNSAHLSVSPAPVGVSSNGGDIKRESDQPAVAEETSLLVLRVQHRSEGVLAYNEAATHCNLFIPTNTAPPPPSSLLLINDAY